MEPARPNILFIMTDQQRADALGCAGGLVQTPHLDALAARGARFTNCFVPSPVCMSCRLSLATGLYPHNTGVWNNGQHTMKAGTATWMQAIRTAGYRTSLFGKTHYYPHKDDMRDHEHELRAHGFDDIDEIGGPRASTGVGSHMTQRWEELGLWDAYKADYKERFSNKPHVARPSVLPLEEYADTYVGRRAVEYLEGYDREEPWFCWVSFGGPHEPWDSPEPYHSMYAREAMPEPLPRIQDAAERPRGELDVHLERRETAPAFEAGDIAAMRADYAGNVTLIDEWVGRIIACVEARGDLDKTFIVFTSDHGEMNGDHGLIYKNQMLDSAVRVPLIIVPAGELSARPQSIASPTEMFDVGPTMVEAAGGTIPHRQFARSLAPVLRGDVSGLRDEVISEIDHEIMIYDGRWKAVLNADGEVYLLVDQETDPGESTNLAGHPDAREVSERLRLRARERVAADS